LGIPSTLRSPHRVVTATREAAVGLSPAADGRLEIGRIPGIAHLKVSREQLRRALVVLQGTLRGAGARGWEIVDVKKAYDHPAGIGIAVRGEVHRIQIFEFTDSRPMTPGERAAWSKWRFACESNKEPLVRFPNGRLRLFAPSYGSSVTRAETERGGFTINIESFLAALDRASGPC
jgi:hypothetical protein